MSISSRLIGWLHGLPPVETRDVEVERDLPVPMPDGVTLLADHYVPGTGDRRPTILIRTPYGRSSILGMLFGRPFAERGFQVLIQSCRGTFGSGGRFDPLRNERVDGLATVAWLKQQPWFSGQFATVGASYMGFTQWAIAAEAGPELAAMAPQVAFSEPHSAIHAGGSFWLDTSLTWMFVVDIQERSLLTLMLGVARAAGLLRPALAHLPLTTSDEVAVGKAAPYFREWLEHDAPNDAWWSPVDFSGRVAEVTAPVSLLGGWYDLFLPHTIADYRRLRDAGRNPQLTIGPWAHLDQGWMPVAMRETLAWFRAHMLGDRSGLRDAPVRVFVMGAEEWRDLSDWPPPGYVAERWHLHPEGSLSTDAPVMSEPDAYRYDPADPTPSVGGSSLSQNSGRKDNRALEARGDVLVYTSAPLGSDVEVMGPLRVELHVRSSLEHTDFFARLCDVAPSGRSVNVSDGLLRVVPGSAPAGADGCREVAFDLWPTAHRFKRGHRIRLQVSSGAHPRFARNPGAGEPLGTATRLVPAEQLVFHDPAHPSAIVLPVGGR